MVITGGLTLLFGAAVWLWMPENPLGARFLTLEEKAQAILRIESNHSGIEQKHFKKHQFVEAMKDPKTWLFFLHAWSQEMVRLVASRHLQSAKNFVSDIMIPGTDCFW